MIDPDRHRIFMKTLISRRCPEKKDFLSRGLNQVTGGKFGKDLAKPWPACEYVGVCLERRLIGQLQILQPVFSRTTRYSGNPVVPPSAIKRSNTAWQDCLASRNPASCSFKTH
jgi:hypothetical protein